MNENNLQVRQLLEGLVNKINNLEAKINSGGEESPPLISVPPTQEETPTIFQQLKTASDLKDGRIQWTLQEYNNQLTEIENSITWNLERDHQLLAELEIFCEKNNIERYIALMLKLMLLKGLTQNVASFIFGKSQPMAHRWMKKWEGYVDERDRSLNASGTEEDRLESSGEPREQGSVTESTI